MNFENKEGETEVQKCLSSQASFFTLYFKKLVE